LIAHLTLSLILQKNQSEGQVRNQRIKRFPKNQTDPQFDSFKTHQVRVRCAITRIKRFAAQGGETSFFLFSLSTGGFPYRGSHLCRATPRKTNNHKINQAPTRVRSGCAQPAKGCRCQIVMRRKDSKQSDSLQLSTESMGHGSHQSCSQLVPGGEWRRRRRVGETMTLNRLRR
jgi:hypothetical protein